MQLMLLLPQGWRATAGIPADWRLPAPTTPPILPPLGYPPHAPDPDIVPPTQAGALVLYVVYFPHLNAAVHLPAADEVDRLLLDPAVLK